MPGPIQLRDPSVNGYLDAAGVSNGDGTALLLTSTGRSGHLVASGESEAAVLWSGPGELVAVSSVGATATATASFYDAAETADANAGNLIWQGVPTNTPAAIDYPFTRGLVMELSEPTTSNVRVVTA